MSGFLQPDSSFGFNSKSIFCKLCFNYWEKGSFMGMVMVDLDY
ncbi:hypothetical protein SPB_1362 [Streptococcus parauberis NCFD 2020]|uniref:Uncharacterized protein n=1 Tax=Streptococcus parauberis NCFD 2020 TaxID=873447 RepID=F1YXN3_9STRE|nr:hypothetical protein SPB_1362 [Streptococcus parauberis NCFD 2020]